MCQTSCACQHSSYAGGCGCQAAFNGQPFGRHRQPTDQERATARALADRLLVNTSERAGRSAAGIQELIDTRAELLLRYCLANRLPLDEATTRGYQHVASAGQESDSIASLLLLLVPALVVAVALFTVYKLS